MIQLIIIFVIILQRSEIYAFQYSARILTDPTSTIRTSSTTILKTNNINYNKLQSSATAANTFSSSGEEIESNEKQSLLKSTINLVKVTIGSGVLSLPAGLALSVGDIPPKAILPSVGLMGAMALLSAYSFSLLGRLSSQNKEKEKLSTYGQVWESNVGQESSWIIAASIFFVTFAVSLSYTIVIGDSLSSLFSSSNSILSSRHACILFVISTIIYPLCSLNSTSALAPFSATGLVGVVLTSLFMLTRLVSCAYSPGTLFHSSLAANLQPSFHAIGVKSIWPNYLFLISLASSSFCVHFDAPQFYNSLRDNNMKRWSLLTVLGFSLVFILSFSTMILGYLTFGGNCAGMILNNYSTLDKGAMFCRFFTALSLIGSFPFIVKAMIGGLTDFCRFKNIRANEKKLLPALLGIITSLALVLNNSGFVVSFNGAIMGTAISYIYPSIMFLQSTQKRIVNGVLKKTNRLKLERYWNKIVIVLGIVLGVCGGAVSIMDYFFPSVIR